MHSPRRPGWGMLVIWTTIQALVVLAGSLLAAPLASDAQPPAKVPGVGYLSAGLPSEPIRQRFLEAFRQGLRVLGYDEGRYIAIEVRWAGEKFDRLPELAAELVRLKLDVLVASASPAIRAAKGVSGTIPIVMVNVVDPVATGFVASLARPGGNIAGLSMLAPELVGKQLELLREVVPKVSRIAVLWNPANPSNAPQLREAEVAPRALGVRLQPLEARGLKEIDSAFVAMARERAGALIVLADPVLASHRTRVAELAAKSRLPSVYWGRELVEAGGLMSYGSSLADLHRRAATYVDKILKGAKPADLPVEQPTKFELVINLKTAKGSRRHHTAVTAAASGPGH